MPSSPFRRRQRNLQLESLESRQLMASLHDVGTSNPSPLGAINEAVQTQLSLPISEKLASMPFHMERAIALSPLSETPSNQFEAPVRSLRGVKPGDLNGFTPDPFPEITPSWNPPTLLPDRPSVGEFVPRVFEEVAFEASREGNRNGDDGRAEEQEQPLEMFESDASFRLGTYNFQAFPIDGLNPAINFMSLEYRAERLAARIIAGNYDVIALQEVWDDDAKEVLIRELSTRDGKTGEQRFPYVVAKLASPWGVDGIPIVDEIPNTLDSGLMLFSKLPFENLVIDGYPKASRSLALAGTELAQGVVAFTEFPDAEAAMDEQAATKGAGYVRLSHAAANKTYGIVFTHMLNGSFNKVKGPSFDKIREMLESYSPGNEEIFIVGDLNINGDIQERRLSREITLSDIAEMDADDIERDRRFDVEPPGEGEEPEPNTEQAYRQMLSRLTVNGMSIKDAWAHDNPYFDAIHHDRGTTDPAYKPWDNDTPTPWFESTLQKDMHKDHAVPKMNGDPNNREEPKRIDYILYLHPESWSSEETLAFEQLQLAYDLYDNGQTLSDHIGLKADLNRRVVHGHAADSQYIAQSRFDNDWSTAQIEGWIVQPNGSQWYSLRGGGTYTFGYDPSLVPTGSTGTISDLPGATSERANNMMEGNLHLELFNSRDLSRPIHAYQMDGETGKYHLADGETYMIRAWHVDPQFVGRFELAAHRHTGDIDDMRTLLPNEPSRHVAQAGETTWFQIDTDTPFVANRIQTLAFSIDRPDDYSMAVYRKVGDSHVRVNNLNESPDGSFTWTDPLANGAQLHLAVLPRDADVEGQFQVEWETNLTVAEPLVLGAQSLTDDDVDIQDLIEFTTELTTTGLGGVLAGPAGVVGGAVVGDIAGSFVSEGVGTIEELLGIEFDEDVRMSLIVDDESLFGESTILGADFPNSLKMGDYRVGWKGTTSHKSLPAWHEELASPIAYIDSIAMRVSVDDTFDDDELRGEMPGLSAEHARWMGYLTQIRGDGGVYDFYANLHHGTHRLGEVKSITVWANTSDGDSQSSSGFALAPVLINEAIWTRSESDEPLLVSAGDYQKNVKAVRLVENGRSQLLSMQLAEQPKDDVTIRFEASANVSFSPNAITITPENWKQVQTIAISASADETHNGRRLVSVQAKMTSNDSRYKNLTVTPVNLDLSEPPWQNPLDPHDVSYDDKVTSLDALIILNYLDKTDERDVSWDVEPPHYYDVNGDGFVTPIDALAIVNRLNMRVRTPDISTLLQSTTVGTPSIGKLLSDRVESIDLYNEPSDDLAFAVNATSIVKVRLGSSPRYERDHSEPSDRVPASLESKLIDSVFEQYSNPIR